MANAFTGGASGAAWDNATETAYNREAYFALRDVPVWMQTVDTKANRLAMPGDVEVFTIHVDMSTATTPLTETVDPDAVALGAPTRVSVTLVEQGNATISTLRLQETSFLSVNSDKAEIVGRNMLDSMDAIIQAVADGSTNTFGVNGGVLKSSSSSLAVGSVATTDIFSRSVGAGVVAKLRGDKVVPFSGTDYLVIVHPDVAYDIMAENAATAWIGPKTYGGDTAAVYNGEIGTFQGARYLSTTRVTTATDGSSSAKVYRSYAFGKQAIAEAVAVDPHLVVGNVVDKLKRHAPLGWYFLGGYSLFRPKALRKIYTSSSLGAV